MTIYYIILLEILILFFLGRTKQLQPFRKLNIIIVCMTLILVSGLRYATEGDYLNYSLSYESYKISGFFDGYPIANVVVANISKLIYDDYATWFFLYALFTIGVITYTLYKQSVNFEYSILLFIFMGMWHSSFNAVKQYAAIAVLFWAQKFIVERDLKHWIVSCITAALFHQTALLMIPVYFFSTTKVDIKKVILSVSIGIFLFISYSYLFDIASFLRAGLGTTSMTSDVGSRSVNILRILVNCVPAAMYLYMKITNKLDNDRRITMYGNFSILNAVIYSISINSVYIARFGLYTDIFGTLLYPYLLSKMEKKSTKFFVGIVILILYFIFWNVDLMKGSVTSNFQWVFDR